MPQYMLLIYSDPATAPPPEQAQAEMPKWFAYSEELSKAGAMLGGDGLQPVATATTIRVRDDERMLTDGPYAETKEQLGGYYLLECKDLDDALNWAAQIPEARTGAIEVRPVMDYEAIQSAPNGAEAAAS